MKKLHLKFIVAMAFFCASQTVTGQQKPTEQTQASPQTYTVALKTAAGKYISMVPNGGLAGNGAEISAKQIFTVIDLNGGTLVNGDKVKIAHGNTLWREDKEKNILHRVPARGAKDEECTFRVRVKGKTILLETPSGKFVTVSADGKTLETREKPDEATTLEAVPAPAPTVPVK